MRPLRTLKPIFTSRTLSSSIHQPIRTLSSTHTIHQSQQPPLSQPPSQPRPHSQAPPSSPPPPPSRESPHTNFYKSHGRALFKSLTLAFLSYQIFYWSWLTLETETMKDENNRVIEELKGEVTLLNSGRGSHVLEEGSGKRSGKGTRLLDEDGPR